MARKKRHSQLSLPEVFEKNLRDEKALGIEELWARERGYHRIIGVDEAGRGPIAGPVVAAAVSLPEGLLIEGLDDSKKLSEAVREKLFPIIKGKSLAVAASFVSNERIDEVNILQASLEAMLKAAEIVERRIGGADIILVDGNQPLHTKKIQKTIVKGDTLSSSIAAASVIAKVLRDRWMRYVDRKWPQYGFKEHKGYPTKKHIDALVRLGACPIHRQSYKPVHAVLPPSE